MFSHAFLFLSLGFLTEGSLDYVAAAGALYTLVLAYLGTKFLRRTEFSHYKEKKETSTKEVNDRLVQLEKSMALSEQPVKAMADTLVRIEAALREFMTKLLEVEGRIIRLEEQRDANRR